MQRLTRFTQWAIQFTRSRRRWLALGMLPLLLLVLLLVLVLTLTYRRAQQALWQARVAAASQDFLPVTKTALAPLAVEGFTLVQNRQATRGLTQWRASFWAATEGGLLKLAPDGKVQRAYTVMDGLPASDLTACAVFQNQLWLGTRAQGLLSFDGARFTRYDWPQPAAQAVTALREDQGRLLIGTFANGLLAFDGAHLQEIKATHQRLRGVTFIERHATRLYVGTFADGLWRNEAARWQQLTTATGLPSNRVVGVSETADRVMVATDFGLASAPLSLARAETLVTLPTLAGLAQWQGRLFAVCENGTLYECVFSPTTQLVPHEWRKPAALTDSRLWVTTDGLCLLSGAGIWRVNLAGKRSQLTPFSPSATPALADNLVTALGFDDTGNLWAGTLRHGVSLLDRAGHPLSKLDTVAAQEINALSFDATTRQMLVATTQGLWQVNDRWQALRLDAGLSASRSASVSPLALATNRGLALKAGAQWHVITTVQGLPSNDTYAVQALGRKLYVGTLSGLSVIESGRVTHTFTTANSALTHHWITALTVADGRLFVGTYGGGVFTLTPAGELASLKSEFDAAFVNPNALASDGQHLLVGTLNGAFVFDAVSQRVQHFTRALPDAQVLSVAADERAYWFGTTSGLLRVEQREFLARQ